MASSCRPSSTSSAVESAGAPRPACGHAELPAGRAHSPPTTASIRKGPIREVSSEDKTLGATAGTAGDLSLAYAQPSNESSGHPPRTRPIGLDLPDDWTRP
jgi:hypothetical protein